MSDNRQTKRNLWFFPLGTIGRDMIYTLFTNYILTYVLFTRSLTAAQLSAITLIIVAARIFDALNDPIMGNIIEHTRSRWGKFKPWLVVGILLTSAVVYFAFNTTLTGWAFVWFFALIYFFYSIAYTMHDISYWGMVAALGSNAADRDRFTSRASLFAGIGAALAGVLIPMLTTGQNAIGGSTNIAYGRVALLVGILAPLLLCFTIFGVKENRSIPAAKQNSMSLKAIVKTLARNDQLMWIALIFLIQQVGGNLTLAGVGSTYVYFEFGYQGGLYSIFTFVGLMASGFLMMFYPVISRKHHRRSLMRFMMAVSAISYALMLLVGLLMPTSTMLKFWLLTIGFMAANFGQNCFYLIMMISIINTVEYNEYRFGTRDEAMISSLRPFLTKLASAIIAALTSFGYIIFGVTGYTNRISVLEQQASTGALAEADKLVQIEQVISEVSHTQTIALLLMMTILPCLLMYVAYRLYQKHYKLDENEYARICQELNKA